MTSSSPSPYLAAAWSRLADRGVLIRRDMDLIVEGVRLKSTFLDGLWAKIVDHRRDDLEQLSSAHQESWPRWGERLNRINDWKTHAQQVAPDLERLKSWRAATTLLSRAQTISQRHGERMTRKTERLEKSATHLFERLQQWSDRVILKEMELREFMDRRVDQSREIVVPAAMKRTFLQFLYDEREAEGRFAAEIKTFTGQTSRSVARLARLKERFSSLADAGPAHFQIHKNQILEAWGPTEQHFDRLAQHSTSFGSQFEQTRLRLRDIYEVVQRMRMVEIPEKRRPLLHRLFNLRDE